MGNFKKVRYGPESYMGFNRPGSGNWKDFDHPVINRWIEDQKAGRGSQMTYNFLLFNDHASIDDLGGANNRWYPSLTGPTGGFPGCWPFCDGHVTCCTGPTCATGYDIPGCCEPFQRCFDIPDDDDEEIPPDGGGDIDDIDDIDDGPEPQDGLINDYSLKFDGTSRAEAHGIMSDLSSATTGTIIISFKSSNFYNIPSPTHTVTKHELFKFYDSQDEDGRTIELYHGWGGTAYNAWELTYVVKDSEGLTVNKTVKTMRQTNDITPGHYPLQNETWHQIAIVQSNDNANLQLSFFVDGQNGISHTNGINYDLNYWFADFTQEKRPLDKFRVGHNFKGKIDEVAIWDTALSESQIESIYLDSVATGPTCPTGNREVRDLSEISNGPIGWWRMGDESITGPISEPFDPSSLTNLVVWFDSDDSSTITKDASSNLVSEWADKSDNNNHAIQSSSALQPADANLGDGIEFDGSNDGFVLTNDINERNMSLFVVMKGDGYIVGNNNDSRIMFHDDSGSSSYHNLWWSGTVGYGNEDVLNHDASKFQILEFAHHGMTSDVRVNGVNSVTKNTTSDKYFKIDRLGLKYDGNTSIGTWDGNVLEVIAVTTTTDREKIEGYLAHKWGLEGDLDSSHPYKDFEPIDQSIPTGPFEPLFGKSNSGLITTVNDSSGSGNDMTLVQDGGEYPWFSKDSHGIC